MVNGLVSVWKVGQFGEGTHWGRPASCGDDGRTIVGHAVVDGQSSLFVDGDAPDALSQVLASPDAAGWTQLDIVGISDDGKVIAGNGKHGTRIEGWVARLP